VNIRRLADVGADDLELAGGKGANLGELVRAGFEVPPGFVITTGAYREFVAGNDLAGRLVGAVPADSEALAGAFSAGAMPATAADEITAAYAALGTDVPVAVRSSATAEDLEDASFAGQQDTFLNVVGAPAVLAAVKACWASLWTQRAISYRAERGLAGAELALAVVVQEMVPATAAGVMFTANPANGRTSETVITAAWGLGEAVVSGEVDTDTVVVDTDCGTVLSAVVADKAVRTDPLPGGGTALSPTVAEVRLEPVLDTADALRLAGIGSAIEAHFGRPMDIEWALVGSDFSILQARPITALAPRVGAVPDEWPVPAKGLYFRASITEQLPDPLSTLFADLTATAVPAGLNRMFDEFSPGADFGDISFPTINGYAFYRYSMAAMGRMMGSAPPLMRRLYGNPGWVEERWRARLADYRAEVAADDLAGPDASAGELLAALGRLVDAVAYYYTAVQTIIPLASMAELTWTGVYERLLRRPGDPAAEVFLLGYDSEPIRAERDLYDLAQWVRSRPDVVAALADPAVDALAATAPSGVDAVGWAEWQQRLAAHLAEHGHTLYNLDFVNPVAADDPAPVLQAMRFAMRPEAPDPRARQAKASAAREEAAERLLARLSGWRRERTRKVLERAQHTGPLREDALSAMGLYLPPARRILRELGTRLVAAGALDDPMDVCWLSLDEARAAASALDSGAVVPDHREAVADRQADARGEALARPPQYLPKNAAMDSFAWMYPAKEEQDSGNVLTGTAGSGGVVSGIARVLAGPADFAAFSPGEILVASITTPAYTPLFAMAAGVVTDIGGVLSHGSIVAREYGIPAVLGVGVATRRIRNGDLITVDGAAGTVRLPSDGTEPEEAPEHGTERRNRVLVAVGAGLAIFGLVQWWRRRRQR
jgi:pyruvate,water dikinase